MKQNIGIWLDGKEAYIIPGGDDGKMQRIRSDVDFREREPGEGKKFGRFGTQFLDQERQKERRVEQQIDNYLDAIIRQDRRCRQDRRLRPLIGQAAA